MYGSPSRLLRQCASIAATLALPVLVPLAQAQTLSFKPQRIVMDARTAATSLSLTNSGKNVETYRIELVDMIYQDDGKVLPAAKTPAGHPSAKDLVRFSPSQVRLQPGESQTVRILLKSQAAIPDGEYRVHALLRQLPSVAAVKPATQPNVVAGSIGVEQAVAIPVILRRGNLTATGSISGMKIVDGKAGSPAILDLWLSRQGARSLYTNLLIKDKAGAVVQETKGVAVPVPNLKRRYLLSLGPKLSAASIRAGGYSLEMVDHDGGAVLDKKPIR